MQALHGLPSIFVGLEAVPADAELYEARVVLTLVKDLVHIKGYVPRDFEVGLREWPQALRLHSRLFVHQ